MIVEYQNVSEKEKCGCGFEWTEEDDYAHMSQNYEVINGKPQIWQLKKSLKKEATIVKSKLDC